MPLPRAVEDWIADQSSEATRRAYRSDITLWVDFLTARDVPIDGARRRDGADWRTQMENTPTRLGRLPEPRTVARRLASVASWYAYLCDLDEDDPRHLDHSPFARLKRPTVDRAEGATAALDEVQAEALIAAAQEAGAATHVAVTVLLSTAIRAAELLSLDVRKIRPRKGRLTITVRRKGGKAHTLPLPDRVADDVEKLRGERTSGPLLTRVGSPDAAWEYWQLHDAVAAAGRRAGLTGVTQHVLRATWATVALANGTPLDVVQDVMGHSSPETTRGYDRGLRKEQRMADAVTGVFEAMRTGGRPAASDGST
jgi:integrase/recombinase XerC/integrase/recombinase XerD